ncbi:hypothetical protein LR48_Vigan04g227300 [Vigna angularis]|uniref:Myb/SANT-like domain-containing protein n=2 Tax=Phaseolus angularis TaxID=3914 RepID=A0A0L9UGS0_PHAAN|nr:uncharacterized protein LOC108330061 isoform X1 [Vigna angularis]KAG2400362.1 uncharacterized protein HKW66_Vig0097840 [Vigna angularis]KOM42075.1 hypothetical protein LR48_Vigan04g227300 [Vigna angularis]BAT78070.1 hypothetical protein VIGAN_02070700 [Vigna angularis var. angularis]
MSGQSQSCLSNGTERSRMHWTPLMERYFIDLMLEHLQRGNRVGHTFNKQAWTDMLNSFNANFGSQFDKDVLKTRYTNLWKQFNDVKSLLSQFGFSWDAARQMVVADDDSVWDVYLKSHPDTRCYRTKAVLNFDDLCVIYGNVVADGRYSLSSHDVRLDDKLLGLHLVDATGTVAVPSSERTRTDWTASMDQLFIELMVDQLSRGNRVDNGFNKKAWTDMLAIFNSKFGCQHGRRVLKNRFKKLLKYYRDITNLVKQGFSWNEQQQMLLADDDIWDSYVKAHPHARIYRSKTLPNYRDLELIFRNVSENEISNLQPEKNHEDVISEETKDGLKISGELSSYLCDHFPEGEVKGSRNPSGTDRTRTYWTPPMDRCLINLLLDQVKHGNRLGQTFISQAWNDMITSFNEQFNSQYDKDVLKNRYKHLRKQFNDVDHLLQHDGFSWDDTREMIDAEDHVWDSYTKAHPEARSLRVKTLPDYGKLCIIFGAKGEQKNDVFSNYDAGSTVEWTESMERCFVDLMIEQVNNGNGIENLFNEEAWMHVAQTFNGRWGLQSDKKVLMDQYLCLMKKHDDIYNILSHSEFAWNETLQTIIAEDDVWDAYIKDHPDAISYKNKCLYLFHDLCKIFGNKVMEISNVKVSNLEQLHLKEEDYFTIDMGLDETSEDLVDIINVDISEQDLGRGRENDGEESFGNLVVSGSNEIDIVAVETNGNLDVASNNETSIQDREKPMTHHVRKRPGTMMSRDSTLHKKKLRMKEALSEMASAVKALMNKRENSNSSFEDALSVLQAMPDIDEELVMDASDLLEDETKAKIFLALDTSLRKKWLLRKLRQ